MRAQCLAGLTLAVCVFASFAHATDISIQGMPPVVVRTIPESGSVGVDPALAEIRVTFSKDMLDGGWSCVNLSKETFPAIAGDPKYDRDQRTFILPVKLEPGKTYAVLLNNEKFKNFKDRQKHSAMPYLLIFETRK
ncbi:MAG: Ig-like domain-containing protein [Candidatus Krumholzibacteria bacterium]|nr:Ig-like domain-containing protein [Candidatus Krumholzibacteria bacterium]